MEVLRHCRCLQRKDVAQPEGPQVLVVDADLHDQGAGEAEGRQVILLWQQQVLELGEGEVDGRVVETEQLVLHLKLVSNVLLVEDVNTVVRHDHEPVVLGSHRARVAHDHYLTPCLCKVCEIVGAIWWNKAVLQIPEQRLLARGTLPLLVEELERIHFLGRLDGLGRLDQLSPHELLAP